MSPRSWTEASRKERRYRLGAANRHSIARNVASILTIALEEAKNLLALQANLSFPSTRDIPLGGVPRKGN